MLRILRPGLLRRANKYSGAHRLVARPSRMDQGPRHGTGQDES